MHSLALTRHNYRLNVKSITSLEDFLIFLVVLFIGADIIQFNIGVSIRIDQIIAVIAVFVMIINKRFIVPKYKSYLCFALCCLLSAAFSSFKGIGFAYVAWIVFDYVIIFGLIYSYIRFHGIKRFYNIFRKTMYIQVFLVVLQFLLEIVGMPIPFFRTGTFHGIPRPAIWFYETSYFATYLTFWMVVSAFMMIYSKKKKFRNDFFISIIGMVFCTATTGFVAIGLTLLLVLLSLLIRNRLNTLLKIFIVTILCFCLLYFLFSDIINAFVLRLFKDGLGAASGGRIGMYKEIWDVFIDNWAFGVGPGAYGYYMGFDRSYVPSNVTLELLSTCGLFSTIAFYSFVFILIHKSFKVSKITRTSFIKYLGIGVLMFFIILQANQNYLRLYLWMFLAILAGTIDAVKNHKGRGNAL